MAQFSKHAKERTMAWMEREIHTVRMDKWEESLELAKQWQAYWNRIGGRPPERWYGSVYGAEEYGTFIVETEWESLAAREAQSAQKVDDPELKALHKELWAKTCEVYESVRRELYYVVPQGDAEGE
jgi:hypothetical protein